ncbi:hypothetical protein AVEN_234015-1 [Araneus ventricosus]|uniref:Uncharacterized protein n=1 Tax=Araneus ventricosus TaxID=182803 RepID=A0A4Y2LAI0_ARAVE|nr:hypothetical protein AVEN_234015-1 [Araneus ventricosus]
MIFKRNFSNYEDQLSTKPYIFSISNNRIHVDSTCHHQMTPQRTMPSTQRYRVHTSTTLAPAERFQIKVQQLTARGGQAQGLSVYDVVALSTLLQPNA